MPVAEDHWCLECRAAHASYLEERGELARLSIESLEIERYLPATDEEWRLRLDDLAPLVEDLVVVPASMTCPLCRGQKEITIPDARAGDGSPYIDCPWCGAVGVVPDLPEWYYPDLSERRAG